MEFGSRTSIFEKPFINDHVKDDAADDKDSEDGEDDEDDEDDEDGLITPDLPCHNGGGCGGDGDHSATIPSPLSQA